MSLWQSAQVSRTNDSRPSLARDTRNLTQRQAVKYLCHHHHHYHAHYQDYDIKIIAIMLPSPIFWSSISISSVLIFMYHFNSSASVRTSDRRNSINLVAQKSKSHWLTGLTKPISMLQNILGYYSITTIEYWLLVKQFKLSKPGGIYLFHFREQFCHKKEI